MKNDFVKSPLNYVGGKYKLLPQIIPLIPKDITSFCDLFGGGFNVGVNIDCKTIIYNDLHAQVVELLKAFYTYSAENIHNRILATITDYGLSRSDLYGYEEYQCNSNDGLSSYNKTKYMQLREEYNNNPDWVKFYTLIAYSFSNQIRFNQSGEFNMPCGKRDYNSSLQKKIQSFIQMLHKKDIQFWNKDFRECDLNEIEMVYCDPPYYNSTATYNENGGWSSRDEQELLNRLDNLDDRGVKFALSNNLKYDNPFLDYWKNKYNVHFLTGNYSNCNYQKRDKSKDIEVLITNY